MRRRISVAILIAAPVMAIPGLRAGRGSAMACAQQKASTMEIKIDNFSFGPADVSIPVGTTVTWTNRDDIPHTVVSTEKVFKSKLLDTDEKFSFTFAQAGTYPYFCSIHPKMAGRIVVQ